MGAANSCDRNRCVWRGGGATATKNDNRAFSLSLNLRQGTWFTSKGTEYQWNLDCVFTTFVPIALCWFFPWKLCLCCWLRTGAGLSDGANWCNTINVNGPLLIYTSKEYGLYGRGRLIWVNFASTLGTAFHFYSCSLPLFCIYTRKKSPQTSCSAQK